MSDLYSYYEIEYKCVQCRKRALVTGEYRDVHFSRCLEVYPRVPQGWEWSVFANRVICDDCLEIDGPDGRALTHLKDRLEFETYTSKRAVLIVNHDDYCYGGSHNTSDPNCWVLPYQKPRTTSPWE